MLFRQIEYLHAIMECGNFNKAGEKLHVSQSAVSQQIRKLEEELGVQLLNRHNRTFSLTPAGELFYKKSLVIRSDIEQMIRETKRRDVKDSARLRLGYYKGYHGNGFSEAVSEFSEKYPAVEISIVSGSHDELYHGMLEGRIDLSLNDQRRAFSGSFYNLILSQSKTYVQISSRSPLSKLDHIETSDLKNLPCILVISPAGREEERKYYDEYVGLHGEFTFTESMQDARLKIVTGQGFLPVDIIGDEAWFDTSVSLIPLTRNGETIEKNYCAFWLKENSGYYIEVFADILKTKF